jgi:phage gp37-like protein
MSDQGVILPLSLGIDTLGQLLVGCTTYKGEADDAKVHIIKL